MRNSFGNQLTVTLFGESHGQAVGAVLDGLSPGIPVDEARIRAELVRRRPLDGLDSARVEPDPFSLVSGVYKGFTTGTPLCILIPNREADSREYAIGPVRPSHADYTAHVKYEGREDPRGGGHFSGRITAALVAAGGILLPALEAKGVRIGTRVRSCAAVEDRAKEAQPEELELLRSRRFPVLDEAAGERMQAAIQAAKADGDSVGGLCETVVYGLPAGLGEPWFDSLEGLLSHALFSLGGVKGVAFGDGFELAGLRGSQANDAFFYANGEVRTRTNHQGGINGGISNGMPLLFTTCVKPTSSISRRQDTVDLIRQKDTALELKGRHDPAIVRRICPVIDAVTALVLADQWLIRFGENALAPR